VLNKSIFALAAAIVVGSASGAFAVEDPENQIGDRYPFLAPTTMSAPAKFTANRTMIRQVANIQQAEIADPESRIGDRYPLLERTATPAKAATASMRVRLPRQAALDWSNNIEDPESRIGDKYPFLEPAQAHRGPTGIATAVRPVKLAKRKV
jgi:hypothetical protein